MSAASKPSAASPFQTFLSWFPLDEFFSLDLRSLAVLRIGLGIMLLLEWLNRLVDVRMHYSDEGLLPRSLVILNGPFSLFMLSGSEWYAAALMIVGCVLAVLLLVGWRTQFMTLLSWFLLVGAQARNFSIMQGGDLVMRLLLFWGLFLPLGACYSLDALRQPLREWRPRVLSFGSVALIVQMCLIYWFAGAWKTDPAWRTDHTAIYLALSLDGFATHLGHWLLNFPEFLKLLTATTMLLELFGPALLFLPFANGRIRVFVVAAFFLFHFGLGQCIELGNFPPICCLAWLALLPACFWDWLEKRFRSPKRSALVIYYDGDNPRQRTRVEAVRMFLLLYETKMIPAPEGSERLARIRATGSWLVVDAQGQEWVQYDAVLQLVRSSFLYWPLAYVLKAWPRVTAALAAARQWVSSRRPIAYVLNSWLIRKPGELLARALPARPVQPTVETEAATGWPGARIGGWAQNTIVAFLIVYVIAWNIRTLDVSERQTQFQQYFPDQMSGLANVLGLEQSWGLFAPKPGSMDGWYIVPAVLKNGRVVDLYTDGGELTDAKPPLVSATYTNTRTRKYMMNIARPDLAPLRPYYAKYLYNNWNSSHGEDEQIKYLFIIYMEKRTQPDRQVTDVHERRLQNYPIESQMRDPDSKEPYVELIGEFHYRFFPEQMVDPISKKPYPTAAAVAVTGTFGLAAVNTFYTRPVLPELLEMKKKAGQ